MHSAYKMRRAAASAKAAAAPRHDRKHNFERLEHSVYVGRLRLGRYERIAKGKYAAYDTCGRLLGRFRRLANAQKAFDCLTDGGER
jgi:hypothetical protein